MWKLEYCVFILQANNDIKGMLTRFLDLLFSLIKIRLDDDGNVEYEYCCWHDRLEYVVYFDAAATVELERNARNDALRNETIWDIPI